MLQLKIWYKAIQNQLKVPEEWLPKDKISGPADDGQPAFFRKMH